MTDALRYLMNQPYSGDKKFGLPKRPTTIQVAAARLWQNACKGDLASWQEIANRIEGRVSTPSNVWEYDSQEAEPMSLAEAARFIAYILTSQVPKDAVSTMLEHEG